MTTHARWTWPLLLISLSLLLLLALALLAWFAAPRWAPQYTMLNSPWARPALRAAHVELRRDPHRLGIDEIYMEALRKHQTALLPGLVEEMEDDDQMWLIYCYSLLMYIPDGPERSAALQRMCHSRQDFTRSIAVIRMPWSSMPDAADQLHGRLADPSPDVCCNALIACATLSPDPRNLPRYLLVLRQPRSPAVMSDEELTRPEESALAAITCLSAIGGDTVEDALREQYQREKNQRVQAAILQALTNSTSPDAQATQAAVATP